MSIAFDSVVTNEALTAFVREVPVPATHALARLLPDRIIADTKVRFDELIRTNRVAHFRNFDGRIDMTERDSMTTREAAMPPLSTRNMVGEQERLELERLRSGGTNAAPMVQAIYNDAEQGTREIRNRMELARGDVLEDGIFSPAESSGLSSVFGLPGGNLVTPDTFWNDTEDATPLSDLLGWIEDVYVPANGFRPGGMVPDTTVRNALVRNAEIRRMSASVNGTPNIVSLAALNAALEQFDIPPILFTYDTSVDVDGTTTRCLSAGKLLIVPPNLEQFSLGFTAWGISATALELVGSAQADFAFEDAPGIVGVQIKTGPPFRQETFVDAVGMPILAQPRALMVATVIGDIDSD